MTGESVKQAGPLRRVVTLLAAAIAVVLLSAGCGNAALSSHHSSPEPGHLGSTYDHIRFLRPSGWRAVPVTFLSGAGAPWAYWTNQAAGPECRQLPNGGRCGPPIKALHRGGVLVIVGGPPFEAKAPFHPNTTVAGRPTKVRGAACSNSAPQFSLGRTCYRGAARTLLADVADPDGHITPGVISGFTIRAYFGPGNTHQLEQQMRHVLATAHAVRTHGQRPSATQATR